MAKAILIIAATFAFAIFLGNGAYDVIRTSTVVKLLNSR